MAHLLAKLGKEALQPQLIEGVWRKAAISAKNAARLRKEALLAGRLVAHLSTMDNVNDGKESLVKDFHF